MPSYDDRARMVCQNPVAGARFFHFMVQSFLEDVLGVNRSDKLGFHGTTSGYYGTVEQQGRLMLHLHMLLWILENLNPEDVREKIMSPIYRTRSYETGPAKIWVTLNFLAIPMMARDLRLVFFFHAAVHCPQSFHHTLNGLLETLRLFIETLNHHKVHVWI